MECGAFEFAIYTICCNADQGIYYYATYDNPQPTAVGLFREEQDADALICYPMQKQMQVSWSN